MFTKYLIIHKLTESSAGIRRVPSGAGHGPLDSAALSFYYLSLEWVSVCQRRKIATQFKAVLMHVA